MVLFTFAWRLENFSYFWQTQEPVKIVSPEFDVTAIIKRTWRLIITDEKHGDIPYGKFPINMKFLTLYLERFKDEGLSALHLHIETELLKADGSLLRPRKLGIADTYFTGSKTCILNENVNFDRSIAEILPQDILIVRCKMWSTSISFLEQGDCFARTRVAVESMYFIAVVEGISHFKPGVKRAARITSVSSERPAFTGNICLRDKGELVINMIGNNLAQLGFCRVLILDNSGNWEDCGQDSDWRNPRVACQFPLTLGFDALVSNINQYLQNDMMTLKCEVAFHSRHLTPQRIDEIDYEPISEKKNEQQKSSPTLTDDLISLYKEGALCDINLRTESDTFPAHKIILCARSPVFKKMFTTNMTETASDCVDIADISKDTISQLLMFVYTDTTADMDWEDAMALYFAADKYQIDSLKFKCSTFLKLNIQTSNCCELLLLSDRHQDSDLKQFVQDYIVTRDNDVFETDEWRIITENNSQLAMDTMYLKYAKE